MALNRVTEGLSFQTGISTADWNQGLVGQTKGAVQTELLPGSTTVSQALSDVFPTSETLARTILQRLGDEGNRPFLRTANGFRLAAEQARDALNLAATQKGASGGVFAKAAEEIGQLLADGDLLDEYRNAIMET